LKINHKKMPFTPAFIDTGKPKPVRYDISTLKIVEQNQRLRHSRNTLRALVKTEHRAKAKKKAKKAKKQHLDMDWNFRRLKQVRIHRERFKHCTIHIISRCSHIL